MRLLERSYSSKLLRPKPLVHTEEDGSLTVVVTSWGSAEHGQRALDEVVKYVNAAKSDVEVTSPFEFLSCLPDEANYVRTAMLLANDQLYRGENRNEYFSGVEMMVLLRRGSMLAWAHVGSPSVYIQRRNRRLQPLFVGRDLASEIGGAETLAPLPSELLGLEPTCNIQCGHTLLSDGDQLILLSSSKISNALLTRDAGPFDLPMITKMMIQEDPNQPFWLGVLDSLL